MANGRPWYKRYGADFIVGALVLPDAEHKWAYSCIVDMLNDLDRPLPDEPGFICGFTGLSRRKWAVVRANLLAAGKITEAGGYLSNPRFDREREEREAEHQRAVETGREGGKKSAAKRAAQQQDELPLHEQTADKPEINGAKTEDNREINGEIADHKRQKTDDQDQGGLKPARARRGQRLDIDHQRQPIDAARAPGVDDGGKDDLLGLTQAVCDSAGLSARIASRPALLTQSMDIVRSWIAAGVDIRGTAIPVIESATERATEPAHSLNRFAAAVDTAHARKRAADRNGTAPPPKPVTAAYEIEGEAPPMVEFRKAVAQAIGVAVYARWCRALKFTVEDLRNEGDMGLLAVRKNGNGSGANDPARVLDQHGKVMTAIARKLLGVREVWEQFDKGDRQAHSNKPSAAKP